MGFFIHNLHLARHLYISRFYFLDSLDRESGFLGAVARYLESYLLQIKNDVNYILFDTGYGGEFMIHPVYFDGRYGRPRQGRENNATQRIAQGVAVAGVKTFYLINAAIAL